MEKTRMDKIAEVMMEHVCDKICRFPWEIENQEEMEEKCAGCQMGRHVCDILNTYNELNDFEQFQCRKLLEELGWQKAVAKEVAIVSFGRGVNLSVSITEAMIRDYQDCQRCASLREPGSGKDCNGCSLDVSILDNALCELPVVVEKIEGMKYVEDKNCL
ncbi:MAG: hypothetical protein ACRDBO_14435 [Lachnospiraceae bacterium]